MPIVVNSPWPGQTLTLSGKILSLANDSLIGALIDEIKSHPESFPGSSVVVEFLDNDERVVIYDNYAPTTGIVRYSDSDTKYYWGAEDDEEVVATKTWSWWWLLLLLLPLALLLWWLFHRKKDKEEKKPSGQATPEEPVKDPEPTAAQTEEPTDCLAPTGVSEPVHTPVNVDKPTQQQAYCCCQSCCYKQRGTTTAIAIVAIAAIAIVAIVALVTML